MHNKMFLSDNIYMQINIWKAMKSKIDKLISLNDVPREKAIVNIFYPNNNYFLKAYSNSKILNELKYLFICASVNVINREFDKDDNCISNYDVIFSGEIEEIDSYLDKKNIRELMAADDEDKYILFSEIIKKKGYQENSYEIQKTFALIIPLLYDAKSYFKIELFQTSNSQCPRCRRYDKTDITQELCRRCDNLINHNIEENRYYF